MMRFIKESCILYFVFVCCGFNPSLGQNAGASNTMQQLQSVYQQSKAWRTAYQQSRLRVICGESGSKLCGSGTESDQAPLLLATSPQRYDARNRADTGGIDAVGRVKAQSGGGGCSTCVAFAVLGAVQSAVAMATQQDAASDLSEQDFYFCKTVVPGEERNCFSAWSVEEGASSWVKITRAGAYPTIDKCLPFTGKAGSCVAKCRQSIPLVDSGTYSYIRLGAPWEMQRHTRQQGSFVTRFNVYSDLWAFFDKNPHGIYRGPGPGAKYRYPHAIQVVGYDLEQQFWLCKNSWGTEFADGGFFRVAFDAPLTSIAGLDDSYGIIFRPYKPRTPAPQLTPAGKPGCFTYKCRPGDYVSRVADAFELGIEQVLLPNTKVIPEPDMDLNGVNLVLCGDSVERIYQQHNPTRGGGGLNRKLHHAIGV